VVVPDTLSSTPRRLTLDIATDGTFSQKTAPLPADAESAPRPKPRVLSTVAPIVILESAPPSRVLLRSAQNTVDSRWPNLVALPLALQIRARCQNSHCSRQGTKQSGGATRTE
jgi:hypothetical protein